VRSLLVVAAAVVVLAGSLLVSLHPRFPPARSPNPIPSTRSLNLTVVVQAEFIDARHGWLLMAHPPREKANGLYATTDGGNAWRQVYDGIIPAFRFVDRNNGLLVDFSGIVHSTSDGGRTWRMVSAIPVTTTSFALRVGIGDNLGVAALIGTSAPGNTTGWTEFVANGRPMDWSLLGPIHVTSPSNPLVSGHLAQGATWDRSLLLAGEEVSRELGYSTSLPAGLAEWLTTADQRFTYCQLAPARLL
jgi:hypothetical protein